MMFRILAMACCLVMLLGCSKAPDEKKEAVTENTPPKEAPKLDLKGALLDKGYAALLVAFPIPNEKQGDWLAMVTLKGTGETDKLPRFPLASSHSVTVLNIPPGQYVIEGKSWVRKSPPYAGGTSETLTLVAGELLMLKAMPILSKDGILDGVDLLEAGRMTWLLSSPKELPKYIAEAADNVRG